MDELLQPLSQFGDDLGLLIEEVALLIGIAFEVVELADGDLADLIPTALIGLPARRDATGNDR